LEAHLQEEKVAGKSNRKNGKTSKKVKSLSGEFDWRPAEIVPAASTPWWCPNANSSLLPN
jgi:hypothetical protein